MILVITETEFDERGNANVFVSHGVDLDTGRNIILPQVNPITIADFDNNLGEYVIRGDEK